MNFNRRAHILIGKQPATKHATPGRSVFGICNTGLLVSCAHQGAKLECRRGRHILIQENLHMARPFSALHLNDLCGRDLQLLIDPAPKILVQQCTQLIILGLQAVHVSKVVGARLQQAMVPLQLLFQCTPHAGALVTAHSPRTRLTRAQCAPQS
eukprot:355289-Pelagomonas_calceolata.AAC.4